MYQTDWPVCVTQTGLLEYRYEMTVNNQWNPAMIIKNKENNVFKDGIGVKGLRFKLHGNNYGNHHGNHHGNHGLCMDPCT